MSYGELSEVRRMGESVLNVEWRIPNFPSLNCAIGNYYYSPEFEFCEEKWWLKVHPNMNERQNPALGWVGLALWRRGPKPKTFLIKAGVRRSTGIAKEREPEREFSCCSDVIYHWDNFCLGSKLMKLRFKFMPDDVLTITCVIKLAAAAAEVDVLQKSQPDALKSGEDADNTLKDQGVEELRKSLKAMLTSGEDSDVIIKVQGREFRAHRSILRARSPVFQAMFAHDMVERQRNTVTMEDCDQESFPAFLEHVYTGGVDMVSNGNAFSLYSASEKYDLKTLKRACAEFVKKNLTVASFCHALTLAIRHDDKELIERVTEFYCDNALDIVRTAEWQVFMAENPTVANELYIKHLSK